MTFERSPPGHNGQAFNYDGWRNLSAQTVTKGTSPQISLTVNAANNRVANYAYDANGNVTSDLTRTYSYDVENRMESDGMGHSYAYDVQNHRVWDGSTYTFALGSRDCGGTSRSRNHHSPIWLVSG